MGMTITEKIMARAAGKKSVVPEEVVDVKVDRLLINDILGPAVWNYFQYLGAEKVWDPERIIFAIDHRVPPSDVKLADNLKFCRESCKKYDIKGFAEIGRHGVGHQLMVENFTLPGEVAVGTDSHATMYGGVGAFACGITASDAAVIMAEGKIWLQVPSSIKINLHGRLQKGVTAKDLILKMLTLAPLDEFIYKAIEIDGEAAHQLSVDSRLVICNMIAEMGAKNGIIAGDDVIKNYVCGTGQELTLDCSDADARYEKTFAIDTSRIQPLVACPHAVNNVKEVREVRGLPIHQAFLGSCTNGRIEDLQQAAQIIKGRKVHDNVRLLVVPASQKIYTEATRLGLTEIFLEAGAAIMIPSCASCAGSGPGVIGAGERCISTTNRNFQGRMGSKDSEVYLASAYTVAASAITGFIEDPSQFI